jgi:dihydrofolate reductase
MPNIVYIGISLDGYIADINGKLDWLQSIPNPDNHDFGFADFMNRIDAIIMGRNTFDTVCDFEGEWPYNKPVFVLSNSLNSIPVKYSGKAELIKGDLSDIESKLYQKGYKRFYIDGGVTIQNFLEEDKIDEMIITTIPILLGGGTPLFGKLPKQKAFELVKSDVLLDAMVKSHYRRKE